VGKRFAAQARGLLKQPSSAGGDPRANGKEEVMAKGKSKKTKTQKTAKKPEPEEEDEEEEESEEDEDEDDEEEEDEDSEGDDEEEEDEEEEDGDDEEEEDEEDDDEDEEEEEEEEKPKPKPKPKPKGKAASKKKDEEEEEEEEEDDDDEDDEEDEEDGEDEEADEDEGGDDEEEEGEDEDGETKASVDADPKLVAHLKQIYKNSAKALAMCGVNVKGGSPRSTAWNKKAGKWGKVEKGKYVQTMKLAGKDHTLTVAKGDKKGVVSMKLVGKQGKKFDLTIKGDRAKVKAAIAKKIPSRLRAIVTKWVSIGARQLKVDF
jgi:hypothetical protein